MWTMQIVLAIIGLSAGFAIAGGLFSFIVGLGVVSDFADRTHTGAYVMLYEEMIALGGILGNILFLTHWKIPGGSVLIGPIGFFMGVFVGCWSMALAEILNIFPIFIRKVKIIRAVPYMILGIAIGKGIGAYLFFAQNW